LQLKKGILENIILRDAKGMAEHDGGIVSIKLEMCKYFLLPDARQHDII